MKIQIILATFALFCIVGTSAAFSVRRIDNEFRSGSVLLVVDGREIMLQPGLNVFKPIISGNQAHLIYRLGEHVQKPFDAIMAAGSFELRLYDKDYDGIRLHTPMGEIEYKTEA